MTRQSSISLTFIGLSCLVLVAATLAGLPFVAGSAKVLASLGFLVLAFQCGATRTRYGQLLFLGLVLSAFGDVFLIGTSTAFFLAGLGAFLLAHLAYTAAFVVSGVSLKWILAALVPVGLISALVSVWLWPYAPPELQLPVLAYTAVISIMLLAATGTRGKGGATLILVGALMFFLSDLAVALRSIVAADFPHYVWGLPLYYAGQACLALSVSQSRSHCGVPLNLSAR